MKWIEDFVLGVKLPFLGGLLILRTPKLLILSALPAVFTLLLYIVGFGFFFNWAHPLTKEIGLWFSQFFGLNVSSWLTIVFQGILVTLAAVFAMLTFGLGMAAVASPLNDFLAEAAEQYIDPALPPVGVVTFSRRIRYLFLDFVKSVAAIVLSILTWSLGMIPLIGVLSAAFAMLLTTFQFVSYAQTRRGITFGEGLAQVLRQIPMCLGFGLIETSLIAMPGVSVLAIPMGVVGGTTLAAILFERVKK